MRVSSGRRNRMERMEATSILNEKETSSVLFSLEHRLADVFSTQPDSK